MPAGFEVKGKVQVDGAVAVEAVSRNRNDFAGAVKAHEALAKAAKEHKGVRPETTLTRESYEEFPILGTHTERLKDLMKVAQPASAHTRMAEVKLDQNQLRFSADWSTGPNEHTTGVAGDCTQSYRDFMNNMSAMKPLLDSGTEIEGDFMYCADQVPGTYLELTKDTNLDWARDLQKLKNDPKLSNIFWVKLQPDGDLYLRAKKDDSQMEQRWQESWPHGNVDLFRP